MVHARCAVSRSNAGWVLVRRGIRRKDRCIQRGAQQVTVLPGRAAREAQTNGNRGRNGNDPSPGSEREGGAQKEAPGGTEEVWGGLWKAAQYEHIGLFPIALLAENQVSVSRPGELHKTCWLRLMRNILSSICAAALLAGCVSTGAKFDLRKADNTHCRQTTIEPFVPGEDYARYGHLVNTYYDQAWIDPKAVSEDAASVKVKVVIGRDGTVISAPIESRSGIPALDRSVASALNRVRLRGLPPFPEGAKESQRVYIINFKLTRPGPKVD